MHIDNIIRYAVVRQLRSTHPGAWCPFHAGSGVTLTGATGRSPPRVPCVHALLMESVKTPASMTASQQHR